MQKTILTLIAGATIGAGTTLTLPGGSTAITEAVTAADIYVQETVTVLKLIQSDDGPSVRYVKEKKSAIEGVAPLTANGFRGEGVEAAWDAVSAAAQVVCEADESCTWTSMNSAISTGDSLTAQIAGGSNVVIDQDVPELNALRVVLLEGEQP